MVSHIMERWETDISTEHIRIATPGVFNVKRGGGKQSYEASNCKEAISLNQSHHIPVIIGGMFTENFISLFYLRLKAVYDICRLQTADRRLQTADCMRQQDCKLNETKNIVIKVASSSTSPCSEKYM